MALNPTVLVVDDDFSALSLTSIMLERDGITVLKATDAHEALASLSSATPDVIILDLMMSGIDGTRLATILRQRADTSQTPILVFSAQNDEEDVKRAMIAGATDVMYKPILNLDLIAKVRAMLKA